ncbi:MAG: hypothetical protein HC884_14010 [Chloroflexaceae bacterium]|nr:hypothetical protein [Chloroflexaceae bacterium]
MAWNTLLAPLKTVTELGATIVLLNILPLPHIGLLRLVSSAAASLGIWVDAGIDRSLPRFIPELEQHQGRAAVGRFMVAILAIKTLLLLLFGLVFWRFSPHFVAYLSRQVQNLPERFETAQSALQNILTDLAPWLIATVLVLVILGNFYDGLMAYLIGYFRQRAWNLIGLIGSLMQPVLAALLVLLGKGVGGVLVAMVVTPVVSVALAGWQVVTNQHRQTAPPTSRPSPPSPECPPASRSLPWWRFFVYTAMSNVLNLSDYVMSWYFAAFLLHDLAQVALYTTGTAMVRQALALLYTPLVGIQVPLFTRVRGGDGRLPDAYAAVGRILAAILIPGGAGLLLLSHDLILVQYPQYGGATLVIFVLTPCLFLESFLSSAQIILQVYERYWLLLLPRALTLLVVPLLVWVAPHYGLVGVALAIGGGRVIIGLVTALVAQGAFSLRYSWGFFGRVALAALGMTGVVLAVKHLAGIGDIGPTLGARLVAAGVLLVIAAVGALSFGLLLRLLGGLEPEDRQRLLESRLPFRRWLVRIV